MLLDQRGVLGHFQWIWIGDDADPFDHRIPKCDSRSEAVEKWERGENSVFLFCIEQFAELGNISDDVAMRKHDAFRFPGTAAGK